MGLRKNKKANFIIPLVVYPFDIMFSFGQTDEELKRSLKKVGSEFDELLIFTGTTVQGRCVMNDKNQTVVRMPKIPRTNKEYGTLQHEIFHAVTFILYKIGIKLKIITSDEAYAYLIGYVTERVYDSI